MGNAQIEKSRWRTLRQLGAAAVIGFSTVAAVIGFTAVATVEASIENPYIRFAKGGGKLLPNAKPWPGSRLLDHNGQTFDQKSLLGKWSVVFFGYTSCADVCPMTLSVLNNALAEWNKTEKTELQVVFVSVDPARDTVPVLKDYTQFFNPKFVGTTGSREQIDRLVQGLGARYEYHDRVTNQLLVKREQLPEDYVVAHTPDLYIISPQGEVVARIFHTSDAEMLAYSLRMLEEIFPSGAK